MINIAFSRSKNMKIAASLTATYSKSNQMFLPKLLLLASYLCSRIKIRFCLLFVWINVANHRTFRINENQSKASKLSACLLIVIISYRRKLKRKNSDIVEKSHFSCILKHTLNVRSSVLL